jgi:hypothetical protein
MLRSYGNVSYVVCSKMRYSDSKNRLKYIDFNFPLLTAYEFCALQGDYYDPPMHSELEMERA